VLDTETPIDQLLQATPDWVQQEYEQKSRANNDQRSRCARPGKQKSNKGEYSGDVQDQEESRQEMAQSRAFERYLC
jgi:hypothetical protein